MTALSYLGVGEAMFIGSPKRWEICFHVFALIRPGFKASDLDLLPRVIQRVGENSIQRYYRCTRLSEHDD